MNVVTAADPINQAFAAEEVTDAIEKRRPALSLCAQAGAATLAEAEQARLFALVDATGGRFENCTVADPLGHPRRARFGLLGDGDTAVIDSDEANGLALVGSEQRDPLATTSYGTGELIRAALDAGVTRIVVALGASAANDGGLGLVQALGARMSNVYGEEAGRGGASLAGLTAIGTSELDRRLSRVTLEVACLDLNPLCGPRGAARLHGILRGAGEEAMLQLDANLSHYADLIRHQLGVEVKERAGAGAAGGQGAALGGILGASLGSAAEVMASTLARVRSLRAGQRTRQRLASRH